MSRSCNKSLSLLEQRIVGCIGIWSERRGCSVVSFGICLPLCSRCRIFKIIDAVSLDDPWSLDPRNSWILIHLAVALPFVHRIESEQVDRLAHEFAEIVRVQFHAIYAADASAWPEKVWLIVVIDIDVRIECSVPSLGNLACVGPVAEKGIWAQRMVCDIKRAVVARHIEFAVVFRHVRSHRDAAHMLDLLIFPVYQIGRNPCSSSGAVHVIFILILQDCHVAGCICSRTYFHREWIAVLSLQLLGVCACRCHDGKNRESRKQLFHIVSV